MTDEKDEKVSNIYNLPGNSNKSKEEGQKKQLEKITSGSVIERKPPLGRRIAETFAGDTADSVGQYILFDVVIPAVKSMVSDAVSQGIERLLFGGSTRSRSMSEARRTSGGYNKMYKSKEEPREISNRARSSHDLREVVLESRGEAELVIETLNDLIKDYDIASMSDLYELVGIVPKFTDDKYGWTDLRSAKAVRVSNGYLLDLPTPTLLD